MTKRKGRVFFTPPTYPEPFCRIFYPNYIDITKPGYPIDVAKEFVVDMLQRSREERIPAFKLDFAFGLRPFFIYHQNSVTAYRFSKNGEWLMVSEEERLDAERFIKQSDFSARSLRKVIQSLPYLLLVGVTSKINWGFTSGTGFEPAARFIELFLFILLPLMFGWIFAWAVSYWLSGREAHRASQKFDQSFVK
jgi:hypothetical protein